MSIFRKLAAWTKKTTQAVQDRAKSIDMKHTFHSQEWLQKSKHLLQKQLLQSKQFIINYKKQAIISATILTVGLSGAGMGHTYYQSNISTVYHVYLHGQKIGTVDNPELITSWIEDRIEQESNRLDHITFQDDNSLQFEAEEIYQPDFDNEAALAQLESQFSLKADAVKLVVDGHFIGYVSNEESIHTILDSFKREYVSEEILATLDDQAKDKKSVVSIASVAHDEMAEGNMEVQEVTPPAAQKKIDELEVVDVVIKQEVELESETVHPHLVLNEEQLKEKLSQSKVEKKIHVVQEGDVLGSIAQKYGLKIRELLDLNPDVTEKTVLQIGQEFIVTAEEPLITVLTVERISREEKINYEIETKSDPDMFRGDTRIEQEGKAGKKVVDYLIIKENGQVIEKKIEDEEIIEEPVTKIMVRGEKVKPSRGDGSFKWPTMGGSITSGFGKRWGRLHQGIDISGVKDKTIMAADNGKVTTAGWHRDYGNYVIIDHDNGYQTLYAHLESISVSKGDIVQKGDT
nr:M23 family metallopeptidase [Caldalkalibacillus mannanilyticus]